MDYRSGVIDYRLWDKPTLTKIKSQNLAPYSLLPTPYFLLLAPYSLLPNNPTLSVCLILLLSAQYVCMTEGDVMKNPCFS